MYERPDFDHNSPETCVSKLFNMIQACRADLAIMRGRSETYPIDADIVKSAEALAQEIRTTLNQLA